MYLCNSQNQCEQNYSLILTFIRKKLWPCLFKGETSGDATSGHLGFSRLTENLGYYQLHITELGVVAKIGISISA